VALPAESYAALLRLPAARRLVYALTGACVSFGMVPLAVLLTVQRATDSYPTGGIAAACFALTAGVSAPLRGRLVDRRGMRRWLPAMALAFAAATLALDAGALASAPAWLLVVLAGVAGVTAPPLFASARSLWPRAVDQSLVRRGYAVTSLIADLGQIAGPALAGVLFLLADWPALAVCAVTAVVSGILLVRGPEAPASHERPTPMPRLRETPKLAGLLAVSVLFGAAIGLVQVGVPAVADLWGSSWLAGPLLAAFAGGSVAGAIWFGSRRWRRPVLERYLLCALALGLLIAPVALATSTAAMAPLLVVAGLAYGPLMVSTFESLDVLAPGGGAEALTWVTTAEAGGWAAGSAVASVLAIEVATWSPFVLASLLLVVPVGALLLVRSGRRRQT
jgi:MFS family permease